MSIQRSVLAIAVALAFGAGATACDPGSDQPSYERSSGAEKPGSRPGDDDEGLVDDQTFGEEGLIDDQEGVVPDDTFGEEGLIDDQEGVVPDDTFGDEGIIDDNP